MKGKYWVIGLVVLVVVLSACQMPVSLPSPSVVPSSSSTVMVELAGLVIDDTPSPGGYERDLFGPAWQDRDRNGCDTRNDVLARDLSAVVFKAGTKDCVVLSGVLDDPYTGEVVQFQRGNETSTLVQIDHVVPLAYAWAHGAASWTDEQRLDFANDQSNLLAVSGEINQSKQASGPGEWLPPSEAGWCGYATRFIDTAVSWKLSIASADRSGLVRALGKC